MGPGSREKARWYGQFLLTGSADIRALPGLADTLVGRMALKLLLHFGILWPTSVGSPHNRGKLPHIRNKNPHAGTIGLRKERQEAAVKRHEYTMGFVDKATAGIGGFVGRNEGIIETSFSIGAIPNAGNGFLGTNVAPGGTVVDNFYDQTTSGKTDTTGATPLPTTQIQFLATFPTPPWEILDAANGTGSIWGIVDGSSYPYLNWQPAGTGTRP